MSNSEAPAPAKIKIADAHSHVGERVTIQGWLYNLRKSGKIVFPVVRDGSGMMQCVAVKTNVPEAVFESLKGAHAGKFSDGYGHSTCRSPCAWRV